MSSPVILDSEATVWRFASEDGKGGSSFDAPFTTPSKSAVIDGYAYGAEGRVGTDAHVFYIEVPISKGDFILDGTSVEASPTAAGALEVKTTRANALFPSFVKVVA